MTKSPATETKPTESVTEIAALADVIIEKLAIAAPFIREICFMACVFGFVECD